MNNFEALRALSEGKTIRLKGVGAPVRLHEFDGLVYFTGFGSWAPIALCWGGRSEYEIVEGEKL